MRFLAECAQESATDGWAAAAMFMVGMVAFAFVMWVAMRGDK